VSTWYVVIDDGAVIRASRKPIADGIPLHARAYAVEALGREDAVRKAKERYRDNEPTDAEALI
jgi:hypothetical protein